MAHRRGRRLVTCGLIVACAVMCACGVTSNPRPIDVGIRGKPKPCVWDESHPTYKQRTLRVGQREFKLRLGRCVPDAEAVAILRAYIDDQVMDRRANRTPLRHSSAERIYLIFKAGSWRSESEAGFANSEYAVSLASPEGTLHMQFVSVETGSVMLWGDIFGEI
jgi:hypothetical protein